MRVPRYFLQILVIGLGGVLAVAFCAYAVQSIKVGWPLTYAEGTVMAGIIRVRAGEPLYHDFQVFPYVVSYYPPGLYILDAAITCIFGLNILATLFAARIITLVASFITVGLAYALARRIGVGRLAALASAGLLLPTAVLDRWGFSVRADVPAVALCVFAAIVLLRQPNRPWLSASITVLAILMKQTMVAFPVAACVWLFLSGRRAAAFGFAGVYAGLFAVASLALHFLTDGNYELNVLFGVLVPTDFRIDLWKRFVTGDWLPLILAFIGMIAIAGQRWQCNDAKLIGLYFITALGVAAFTLRGRGSDLNHLIETTVLACALAGVAIDLIWRLLENNSRGGLFGATALACAVLISGGDRLQHFRKGGSVFLHIPVDNYWLYGSGALPGYSLPVNEIDHVKRVLAEEPTMVLLARKAVLVSDIYHLSMMTTVGRWNPEGLETLVLNHYFDLIVMGGDARYARYWLPQQPLWPEVVRRAVVGEYLLTRRDGPFWLYTPKNKLNTSPSKGSAVSSH